MNTGPFLNEITPNLQASTIVFIVIGAPIFGYFFNRLMDRLNQEHEHTSLYVALGVFVTLIFISLLSWKSAVLAFVIFALTGLPMIVGEFTRTDRKRKTARVKRLPYKANGLIDDAKMASAKAGQEITKAINAQTAEDHYKHLTAAVLEMANVGQRLNEVKQIQLEK